MDRSKFTENQTGNIVKVRIQDKDDWGFIPNALPPAWEFPTRLWPLLQKANNALARLDEKGKNLSNISLLLIPLQKREALRSSSLEGTYASPKQLLMYELDPTEPSTPNDPVNEWREVHNYDLSLRFGTTNLSDAGPKGLPLSLRLIREMHRLLLDGVRGENKRPGEFREYQVQIGSDARYVPPPPGTTLVEKLEEFEQSLHSRGEQFDPLVWAYLAHYQFEAIHPFLDGNGRVGRALLALTTFKWCGLAQPWLYMSAYFEKYKDEYIDNLFRVSANGEWERWIEFCLRGTIVQCEDAMRRCDLLNGIRSALQISLGDLPRAHMIIELLFAKMFLDTTTVAKACGTTIPTARADIEKLVQRKVVEHLTGARPRIYYAPAIYSAAFAEYLPDGQLQAPDLRNEDSSDG